MCHRSESTAPGTRIQLEFLETTRIDDAVRHKHCYHGLWLINSSYPVTQSCVTGQITYKATFTIDHSRHALKWSKCKSDRCPMQCDCHVQVAWKHRNRIIRQRFARLIALCNGLPTILTCKLHWRMVVTRAAPTSRYWHWFLLFRYWRKWTWSVIHCRPRRSVEQWQDHSGMHRAIKRKADIAEIAAAHMVCDARVCCRAEACAARSMRVSSFISSQRNQ